VRGRTTIVIVLAGGLTACSHVVITPQVVPAPLPDQLQMRPVVIAESPSPFVEVYSLPSPWFS
jgi:hypothetical protein